MAEDHKAQYALLLDANQKLKKHCEETETQCAIKIQNKQTVINSFIAQAEQVDDNHQRHINKLNVQFFEAKTRLIEERVAEHEAH